MNVTPSVKLTKSSTTITASGSGGSGSGTINFSVGGNANGGFISGGPQLSWLDEENQGEVVIPLGSNRRERGLELWKKTGELLGVQQHADGGFVGRSIKNMGSGRKSGSGQNTTSHGGIQISVGGITIEVKQDGEHSGSLLDAIRNQKGEIGNEIMSIFSEALEEAFSNTPLATQ